MNHIVYEINGGYPLKGSIICSGAKNLATKTMVASLLTNSTTTLYNVPNIGDVSITKELLSSVGSSIDWCKNKQYMMINSQYIHNLPIVSSKNLRNRIPILMIGALIHRVKEIILPIVGGDLIGERNVSYHINILKCFGVTVLQKKDCYVAKLYKELQPSNITLPFPSVGATETFLFLSVLTKGTV